MIKFRQNRLFRADSGRCLNVALDHGFFNEFAFLAALEDIRQAVGRVADAAPDAVQLTPGQARHLQERRSLVRPALVLRTDVANVYGAALPEVLFSQMIEEPVEQALRLDAACVVVNLFLIPGAAGVTDHCIRNILRLKPACDRFGMPLMIEPLVFAPRAGGGAYGADGDVRKIAPLVRQAVELGADVIKADPTTDPADFHKVVEVAGGIPVLVRGGSKAGDREILARTEELIRQGAAGIVYGRNIVQHEKPAAMVRALAAVVHEGASAKAAFAHLA